MSGKQLSVIIPVYNVEKYIAKCLRSIVEEGAQALEAVDVIVVDDGSVDATGTILDKLAESDARIQVIHEENGGLSHARNTGIARARGNYIGFVDGDDWIEPDMYRAMYHACEKEKAQVAACRYKQITKSGVIDGSAGNSVSLSRDKALEIYVCGDERYLI